MPNTRSAAKRMRSNEHKRLRNRSVKSALHTYERRFLEAVGKGDGEAADGAYRKLESALDKAAKRGVIHVNKADRKKSRMRRHLDGLRAPAAS